MHTSNVMCYHLLTHTGRSIADLLHVTFRIAFPRTEVGPAGDARRTHPANGIYADKAKIEAMALVSSPAT
jgi:hypothetical protein